jgi:hypothetical protein
LLAAIMPLSTIAAPAPPRLARATDALHYPGAAVADAGALRLVVSAPTPFTPFTASIAWLEQKVITADGAAGDLFGFRTLIVGDTAFVSAPAPLARPGAVYVFHHDGDSWVQTQKIVATPAVSPPPNWSDFFGWSLSVSGDQLLVGAPEAFDPMFGPAGGAYLFTRGGDGNWTQVQEFASPAPLTLTWFGRAVALAGDAALVGEPSYNMSSEGGRGAVHVFTASGGVWSATQMVRASDGQNMDDHFFGAAIATDGVRVLVGAPGADYSSSGVYPQGSVYAFSNDAGTFTEVQKLEAVDGADGDQFGYAIGLSGTTALIGAPAANIGANVHQGAAYLFDDGAGTYAPVQKLVDAQGAAYDQSGQSVAVRDGIALVGMWSFNDEPGGTPPPPKPGHVGVFIASNGQWNGDAALAGTHGGDGDSFGWDVSIDGANLLIGADADGSVSQYQGAAYFYANDTVFADGFDAP